MTCLVNSSVVLCDEVRREASGQAIIIGARQNAFSVPKDGEAEIARLALYVELDMVTPLPTSIKLKFSNPENGDTIISENFTLEPNDDSQENDAQSDDGVRGTLLIAINKENITVRENGVFQVLLQENEDEWQVLREYIFPVMPDQT